MSGPEVDDTGGLAPDEWEVVKELVFTCQSLSPADQVTWLDGHCPSSRVRQEVERLLAHAPPAPAFLGTPAAQQVFGAAPAVPERVGRFRILHQLGVGGMGVVYAAIDERLGRRVALKVLHPDASQDLEQRRRLLWDARAASALNHPNIVCVYEAGDEAGIAYVAMELVSGHTLADLITSRTANRALMLDYAVQIAGAIEAAHAAGIVHRDLKPSNVMITDEGGVKLVDFGLAKNAGGALADTGAPLTIEGQVAGTVAYMSPEQAEGHAIDVRSDIFSFGSVLYEMLTWRRAFVGGSAVSVLAKILHAEPESLTDVRPVLDHQLAEIIGRCMRKDRDRRFQSMADVRVRLQEVIEAERSGVNARHVRRRRFATVASVALALLGATAWLLYSNASRPADGPSPDWPAAALTRLTWDGGLSTSPAVSADGTLLAYASDRGGRGDLDIWLQRVGGGDPIRLTEHEADDSKPAFSPDGSRLVFRSERDGGGVYVMPSLGGPARLLVPGCHDPSYSPDGRTIACWMGEVGGAFYAGTAHIVLVAAAGGQPRRFRPDFANAAFPLWTPDGRMIFLGRKDTPGAASIVDWWVAPDADGGEQMIGARALFRENSLSPPDGAYWIRPEAWLEGGRRLVFTARQTDATNLWSLTVAGDGTLRGPARPLTLGAAVQAFAATPRTDGDGPFVFASLDIDMQLRRIPLAGARPAQPEPLLPNLLQVGSPSISDDGSRLVFSARQAEGYRIVTVDSPSGQQHTVVTLEGRDFARALISGNGEQIVYNTGTVGHLITASGGVSTKICERCGWPTDIDTTGRQVLFESLGSDEYLQRWSNGRMQPLIASPDPLKRRQFAGRFSPDGHWVAFGAVARDTSTREIIVVPNTPDRALTARQWVSLTDGPGLDREPAWSQDGKTVFFLSDRDGFRCIWSRTFDPVAGQPGGAATAVAHFHHARELLRAPSGSTGAIGLSASHTDLIFTVARSTGNVWWQTRPSVR